MQLILAPMLDFPVPHRARSLAKHSHRPMEPPLLQSNTLLSKTGQATLQRQRQLYPYLAMGASLMSPRP